MQSCDHCEPAKHEEGFGLQTKGLTVSRIQIQNFICFLRHYICLLGHYIYFLGHYICFIGHYICFMRHNISFLGHYICLMGNCICFPRHIISFLGHYICFLRHHLCFLGHHGTSKILRSKNIRFIVLYLCPVGSSLTGILVANLSFFLPFTEFSLYKSHLKASNYICIGPPLKPVQAIQRLEKAPEKNYICCETDTGITLLTKILP